MTAMRAYWILPNREQLDDVLASDGEKTSPLRSILDPKTRPAGFSHGVPTELIEKVGPKRRGEILFAQRFPAWNGDGELVSIGTTAGVDPSGRVVHIGLLFVLGPGERPAFDVLCSGLPEQDRPYASALLRRMTSGGRGDAWVDSVRDLLALPSEVGPATNVALERSVARFHSPYALGPDGVPRRSAQRRKLGRIAILFSIVLVGAGVGFSAYARGCEGARHGGERFAPPTTANGEVSWRFS